jgi:exonuclease SbcC
VKQISLSSIQVAHFRSFVQTTVIDLTTAAGLKLITGDNRVEPRLGANGCGKSTIWDAVCFAVYGTSIKGLRASDLISHGEQTVEVALFFTVDSEEHLLHRAAPPMRIYLDDAQVEQADVDTLIGLSKSQFLNSVVFGQTIPLFLDLPVPARGDLLDETLQLEIWMRAADRSGDEHRKTHNQLTECRNTLAGLAGRLEGLGDLTRFDEQIAAWEQQKQTRLNEIIDEFERLEKACAESGGQAGDMLLVDEEQERQRYEHMRSQHMRARERLAAADTELGTIIQNMNWLADNDICPTCEQPITQAHKDSHNERVLPRWRQLDNERQIAALDTQTTEAELPASELSWRGIVRKNQEIQSTRTLLKQQMADRQRAMDRLEQEAERLSQETNPFAVEAQRVAQEHARLSGLLELQKALESTTVSLLASLDFWRQGFRRARLFCLGNVLRELTVETHNSLLALGLVGWHIDFTTATETKSGTLKLGVQVDIHSPEAARKFEAMSGGEGQRARLAVSLGLASLIQRWAGVRFDLEVFDEPTAFLSEQGIEDLLESLRTRAEINNRSIWLCDHRALIHSGFSEVMSIVKTAEGSRIGV